MSLSVTNIVLLQIEYAYASSDYLPAKTLESTVFIRYTCKHYGKRELMPHELISSSTLGEPLAIYQERYCFIEEGTTKGSGYAHIKWECC